MELKNLLKPPFKVDVDEVIFVIKDSEEVEVLAVATNYRYTADFICAALNEKYEQDFTELRWIDTGEKNNQDLIIGQCTKCETKRQFFSGNFGAYKFCPHCGQRLLPPEGDEQ